MSMQHHPRPIVPIRYSGYRTCCQCGYKFYSDQPAHRDVTCRLCRVEQSVAANRTKHTVEVRQERAAALPAPVPLTCEQCGGSFVPKRRVGTRYCSRTCKEKAAAHRRKAQA